MQVIDTNVLLRYLLNDDPTQSAQARKFIRAGIAGDHGLMIPDLSFAESCWIMQGMKIERAIIASKLSELSTDPGILIENRERINYALALYSKGIKFTDAYLASTAKDLGAEALVSFDHGFKKLGIPWIDPSKQK